jgi:hypothetical protein
MKKISAFVLLASVGAMGLAGCSRGDKQATQTTTTTAVATGSYLPDPNRKYPTRVLWGDEHVHSGWSADAGLAGATLSPEDAVRFARGEQVKSSSGQMAQLHRALDWVALTDHSDAMGTISEMKGGNPEMMADPTVKRWHDMMAQGPEAAHTATFEAISAQATHTLPKILMDPKWMVSAWEKTVDIMEKYNEPGKFTAFIAYEWTSNGVEGQNLHRNVIFRDGADKTRAYPPLTTFASAAPGREGGDPESLWAWLDDWQKKTGGQVLAIPHNANLSNGWMFQQSRYDGTPLTAEWAIARARWEPLYEIFQYKGTSEAHPTLSPTDEFANYGIWDTSDLNGNPKTPGMINAEYWREALKTGMMLQGKFGINPFKYGAVAGTDTHNGLPSGSEENNFWGKFVQNEPSPDRWKGIFQKQKSGFVRKDWTLLAAGITGVWATSNTRADLWDAMKRKETYASSGPRITIRFFGGYDLPDHVTAADIAETGYAHGVPMGGDLKASVKAPTFLFAAMKDPEAGNLDRIQIVKGWIDAGGTSHEKIYDVKWAGDRKPDALGKLPPIGNSIDLKTATYTNSIGATELVGSFTDPDFDPAARAFYYARVIEIPTPRWTAYDAVKYHVTMDKDVEMIQQERAVTSPIWYNPA